MQVAIEQVYTNDQYQYAGLLQSHACKDCGWCMLAVNLNYGWTPKHILCDGARSNRDNPNPIHILGQDSHQCIRSTEMQPYWFNPQSRGIIVDRMWIRPTATFLKMLVKQAMSDKEVNPDLSFDEVMGYQLRTFLSGGLMLVRKDKQYDRVETWSQFGKDKKDTSQYLLTIYRSLLKYRFKEDVEGAKFFD